MIKDRGIVVSELDRCSWDIEKRDSNLLFVYCVKTLIEYTFTVMFFCLSYLDGLFVIIFGEKSNEI